MKVATLWKNPAFLKLWSAHSISLIGSQVTLLALPLTAILTLNASSYDVGVLTAIGYVPFLLIGLPAGVWIREMPLRTVLVGTDVGRAVILLGVPLAHFFDVLSLAVLWPITFLSGALTVFADIAHQSILPELVDKERLADGNTKLQMSYSTAELCGPAIGGALVKALGAPIAVVVDAATFIVSAVLVLSLPRAAGPQASEPEAPTMTLGEQVREGLSFVWSNPLLRPIVLCMAGANVFDMFGMVLTILPLYAIRDLELSALQLGGVLAVANVGALIGAFTNSFVVRHFGIGRTLIGAALLPGIAVLLIRYASTKTAFPVLAGALALAGFGISLFNVNQLSLRQHITPGRLLTRMNATIRFVIWGMIPLGAFLGGLLGGAIGMRRTLLIAGIGSLLSALPLVFSPVRTLKEMPESCPSRG